MPREQSPPRSRKIFVQLTPLAVRGEEKGDRSAQCGGASAVKEGAARFLHESAAHHFGSWSLISDD
jgi:hypothetical protein